MSLCLLVLTSALAFGQVKETVTSTDVVTIAGLVEKEITIGIPEISARQSQSISDVVITNHLGEPRATAKGLKGVLIKELLATASLKAESPKVLSEFYFTFIASDGYAAVYSWNELFNSPTGDHCYLITEKEGKKLADMPDRMLVITPSDFKTGRRFIKGLSRIVVARIAKN